MHETMKTHNPIHIHSVVLRGSHVDPWVVKLTSFPVFTFCDPSEDPASCAALRKGDDLLDGGYILSRR